jgi:hypothetical protein
VFFESCRCIATGDSFIPPLSSIVVIVVVHLRSATCSRVQKKKKAGFPLLRRLCSGRWFISSTISNGGSTCGALSDLKCLGSGGTGSG